MERNFIDKSLYKNFSKTEDNSKKILEFQKSDKYSSIPKQQAFQMLY